VLSVLNQAVQQQERRLLAVLLRWRSRGILARDFQAFVAIRSLIPAQRRLIAPASMPVMVRQAPQIQSLPHLTPVRL
jgi:hypothetical protein